MTKAHLLLIELALPREFLCGRRLEDVFAGAELLGELGHAAAQALRQSGTVQVLQPTTARSGHWLVALAHDDPEQSARVVRSAATTLIRDQAIALRRTHRELVDPSAWGAFDEQIDTALDYCALWTPIDARPSDHALELAYQLLCAKLAGRRSLREFTPWTKQRGGVNKADSLRETVLRGGRRTHEAWIRYQITSAEELDALGLLLRVRACERAAPPLLGAQLAAMAVLVCGDPRLSGSFLADAATIIERRYGGEQLYATPQVLLALLPAVDALACATKLQEQAEERDPTLRPGGEDPSLRGGLVVGLAIDSSAKFTRGLLRTAEEAALRTTTPRAGLTLFLTHHGEVRSGWSAPWSGEPTKRIEADLMLLRKVEDFVFLDQLDSLLARLPHDSALHPGWLVLARREAQQILRRAGLSLPALGLGAEHGPGSFPLQLTRLSDRLRIARGLLHLRGKR